MGSVQRIRVKLTPQEFPGTYSLTEIDITDFVFLDGLSSIRQAIDSEDYDIGVFAFDDLELVCNNSLGKFNEATDSRSIFPNTRDLAIIKIQFEEQDEDTEVSTTTDIFEGIINEDATRLDVKEDQVRFSVLSRDSVLRQTKISAGAIQSGIPVSTAIKTILNVPAITNLLTFNPANINVSNDVTIDDGSVFDNTIAIDALRDLLIASNSIFFINTANEIIVRDRDENSVTALFFFGRGDIEGRENIQDVFEYNTGIHRLLNTVVVNEEEVSNDLSEDEFGARQKSITLDFITTALTSQSIASAVLDFFSFPKLELKITVDIALVKDANISDPVSVNYPFDLTIEEGKFLPIFDEAVFDDADTPFPFEIGSIAIESNIKFKIIEIDHNPVEFLSTLKLRQAGKTLSDGVF